MSVIGKKLVDWDLIEVDYRAGVKSLKVTVARLSGTSIAMIERHYGHLRADHAAAALATLTI